MDTQHGPSPSIDVREDSAAQAEGQRDDEQHEYRHLRHQEEEDLVIHRQYVDHGSHLIWSAVEDLELEVRTRV